MGIRVTIDDFGTGYSSLHCLKTIPLCCLKIDRSFVSDIDESEKANTLIATIMAISRQLDLEVVAEGVEHKYQADYLTSLGCHYMQGYYFSRPIPPEEIVGLLKKQPLPTSNGTSAAALRQATMQSLVELEKPIRLQRSA
jgi:EAL domain-containing protein (putative c-di-GMP-specific phosphodiesterase class I)